MGLCSVGASDGKISKNHSYITKSSSQLSNNPLLQKSRIRADRKKFND